jgi:hypothetical protein
MRPHESDLLQPVKHFLEAKGYQRVVAEVNFCHCVIDVVACPEPGLPSVCVELKIADWRRAVRQARVYQLCAQRVYVALLDRFSHRPAREQLAATGIGLLSVRPAVQQRAGAAVEELLPAGASAIHQERYEQRLIRALEG